MLEFANFLKPYTFRLFNGKLVNRFATGNRFWKRITGYRIFMTIFDGLLHNGGRKILRRHAVTEPLYTGETGDD